MKSSYKSIRKGPVTHTGKQHIHFLQNQNGNGSPTHRFSVSLALRQMLRKHSWWDIFFNSETGTNWKVCSAVRRQIWHHWGVSWICTTSIGGVWAMSIKIEYTHAFSFPLTKPASGIDATHTLHLHGATKPCFQRYSLQHLTAKTWPQFTWVDQIHYDQDL